MKPRVFALAALAAVLTLLAGCKSAEPQAQQPSFDYITVSTGYRAISHLPGTDAEESLFMLDEVEFLLREGPGSGEGGWGQGGTDWDVFETVSQVGGDRPVLDEALNAPAPAEDGEYLPDESLATGSVWVKLVRPVTVVLNADGNFDRVAARDVPEEYIVEGESLARYTEVNVLFPAPKEEDRMDVFTLIQDPEGNYVCWAGCGHGGLAGWLETEVDLFARWHIW